MKKHLILILGLSLIAVLYVKAQKYITKTGQIEIFSETSLFTIEAMNKKAASILDIETGEIVASTLVRSFKFREALVEEHFNENYIESHLYPKSQFKGKISNISEVNLKSNGNYPVTISGDLNIHGVTNTISVPGTIRVNNGQIAGKAKFIVSLEGYKIKIEDQYKNRIKDEIELNVSFNYQPYNK